MTELSQIDALNRRFRIPGIAEVVPGNGGLAKVQVTTSAATAEIYLHGAQVTAWRPASADEVLFISEHSQWQNSRAIRGGIPVCFPWFRGKADDLKAPAHGFVRTRQWQLDSLTAEADGAVTVTCSTESDDSTRAWWPHEFRLVNRISIGRTLALELIATNIGSGPCRFEEALHTYFNVGDARRVCVRGLDGIHYLDNADVNREKIEAGDLRFAAQVDNAYLNTHAAIDLVDPTLRRILRTEKENSATTIVWNPWSQGAASFYDLGDDEWQRMTCVEASNILDSAIVLAPGAQHAMGVTLSVAPK
jgi:glucose-6-phosphate 1-epimerase